jgi:hypothetical protein
VPAHSGVKQWGTFLSSGAYPVNTNCSLISNSVALGSNATLSFWHYYQIESNYDGGVVYISTNNGNTWTLISPVGGYPNNSTNLEIHPAYSSTAPVSGTATFNLSAFAGQTVMFKWYFFSDNVIINRGWYIDDVVVSGAVTQTGTLSGTVSLTPVATMVTQASVKAGNLTTHPAADGTYALYLPLGSYPVTTALNHYSVPAAQNVTISPTALNQTADFSLEFLATPPVLTYSLNANSVLLNWANQNDRTLTFQTYSVYRKLNGDIFRFLASTSNSNYTDSNLQDGTYSYYVTAQYAEGESAPGNIITFTNPAGSYPNQLQVGITRSTRGMQISWNPIPGAKAYYIYATSNPDSKDWGKPVAVISAPATSWTDNEGGKARFYRVCADLPKPESVLNQK